MKIINDIRMMSLVGITTIMPLIATPAYTQNNQLQQDTFEHVLKPGGITDEDVLAKAPSPKVTVMGEAHNAVFVVDIKNHKLFKYDKDGNAVKAYPVATGKRGCSTPAGIFSIGWVEYHPYKYAPRHTKRHRKPYLFGDKAIILYKVSPVTGKKSSTGIMVHGHKKGDEASIGTDASLGCVRLFNPDIIEFAEEMNLERGRYVKFM